MSDELSELLAGMSDDELKALGAEIGVSIELPPDRPSMPSETVEKAGFVRASSLVRDPDALDVGDYEPGENGVTLYKGFPVLPREGWPADHETLHGNQKRRFYVISPAGTVGLVPWDGSQIIWPWDQAWVQDLHRSEVQSLLKEEKPRKGR